MLFNFGWATFFHPINWMIKCTIERPVHWDTRGISPLFLSLRATHERSFCAAAVNLGILNWHMCDPTSAFILLHKLFIKDQPFPSPPDVVISMGWGRSTGSIAMEVKRTWDTWSCNPFIPSALPMPDLGCVASILHGLLLGLLDLTTYGSYRL